MHHKKSNSPLLSERFEVSFNTIHEALKRKVKIKDDRFSVLLRVGADNHEMIKTYKGDLEQYAKLRNAIVHAKVKIDYYIAEPNIIVVEHIEKIASILSCPNYALSIATKDVIYFDMNDSIIDVINAIKKFGYSQYPIYVDREAVCLLYTADILKWMVNKGFNSFFEMENIRVKDVVPFITNDQIAYVSKKTDIFEAEDLFEIAHKNKGNLKCMIITENGGKDEKPLGLITAWDLIQIDYTIDWVVKWVVIKD